MADEPAQTRRIGRFLVDIAPSRGPARRALQERVLTAGVKIALHHRLEFLEDLNYSGWLVGVRDEGGVYRAGFAVQSSRSRALPGHRVLRAERVGYSGEPDALHVGLEAVVAMATAQRLALRLHLEIFSPVADIRTSLAASARGLGFHPAPQPRCYGRTIVIDLAPDLDSLFASLPKKTRRDIRQASRHPVKIVPITDSVHAPRLGALLRETMARTGGVVDSVNWRHLIDVARMHPDLLRVTGLVRTDTGGGDALLAFGIAMNHGDHVQYATAASTRRTDLKLPLAYPVVWDLLTWAKDRGADYFDFGGISEGTAGSEDAVGGISDFKRYFSTNVVDVGDDLCFEPNRFSAAAARVVSRVSSLIRGRPR
jgi:hypothetical protein